MPLPEAQVDRRAVQLHAMIEAPAVAGLRHWRGDSPGTAPSWLADLIERTRVGFCRAPAGSALAVIAEHRDGQGRLLPAGSRRWSCSTCCGPWSRWTST
ncbi:hypothetical protein NKG94_44585 [Micromonospora sp. M12]